MFLQEVPLLNLPNGVRDDETKSPSGFPFPVFSSPLPVPKEHPGIAVGIALVSQPGISIDRNGSVVAKVVA
jgi:hypothetical protein